MFAVGGLEVFFGLWEVWKVLVAFWWVQALQVDRGLY